MFFNSTILPSIAGENPSKFKSEAIDSLIIQPVQLGSGWIVNDSNYVDPSVLGIYKYQFGVEVVAVYNEILQRMRGQKYVQINYYETTDNSNAKVIYEALIKKVNSKNNIVAIKDNVAIEIINSDVNVNSSIINALKVDEIHRF